MLKTFKEANRFLESYIPEPKRKHPGKLGLERMQYFVSLLGNPQLSYPTIHVGGTSGKGSTATMIAYLLATKYKVGLHTSPHLVDVRERIKIIEKCKAVRHLGGGKLIRRRRRSYDSPEVEDYEILDGELVGLVNEIQPIIKKVEESKYGKPSYFEIVAALAFLYFEREKVDFAVIEVGMGGRYDGTNVVRPLVSVLTNVGLDHTEVLGETVEQIARDKAGIIKKGIEVVSGVSQPSVVEIIRKRCKEEGAGLSLLTKTYQTPSPQGPPAGGFGLPLGWFNRFFGYKVRKISSKGSVFDYFGDNTYRDLKLSLLGEHQIQNACLAIRTVEMLNKFSEIRKTLTDVYIPGRLEIVMRSPLVVLDGAHNPDKMKTLIAAIKSIFPGKKVTCIIAIKKGKDAKSMLSFLIPICSKVIFTKFKLKTDLGDTYSYEPEELVNTIKDTEIKDMEIRIVKDSQKAVAEAIKKTKKDDLILITGSLYLIGEIRKFLIFKQIDN